MMLPVFGNICCCLVRGGGVAVTLTGRNAEMDPPIDEDELISAVAMEGDRVCGKGDRAVLTGCAAPGAN